MRFSTRVKLWRYPGKAGWCFVTLPKLLSATITKDFGAWKRGWGSLPVVAMIAGVSWKTSIFPDKKAGAYLLPIKAGVRKKASVDIGDTVQLMIEVDVRNPVYDT